MRSPLSFFSAIFLFFLLTGCHKTGSKGTGLAGEWRATGFYAGPAGEVAIVDKDHVFLLRLSPDSSYQQYFNQTLLGFGTWSAQSQGTPAGAGYALTLTDSAGTHSFTYQALLSKDSLTLESPAPEIYVASYIRN